MPNVLAHARMCVWSRMASLGGKRFGPPPLQKDIRCGPHPRESTASLDCILGPRRNRSAWGTETGTQLVLTGVTAFW